MVLISMRKYARNQINADNNIVETETKSGKEGEESRKDQPSPQ